jgi:glycosyltransferase involved in cell wall biosynthesis
MNPSGTSVSPAVSVIIATYNRSQTLRHAIQSVRNSLFTDWELIVVGDACTDDTAECVSAFGDPRIQFVNLPIRCGDQSGPNNHGLALARGRYVAFLNHDDFYLPDHLTGCVTELEASGADLVWVPCAVAHKNAGSPGERPFSFALEGVPHNFVYAPLAIYFASSWVFRRELAGRVGPWRSPEKIYVVPSQDWLFRAWRSGANLRFLRSVTVVVVSSGARVGSYTRRTSSEHELLAQWFHDDPNYRERILEEAAVNEAAKHFFVHRQSTLVSLALRALLRPIQIILTRIGIHPLSASMLQYGSRGGFVRHLRKITGAD